MLIADQGALAATDPRLNGKKLTIGIVQARFNADITNALAQACHAELLALGQRYAAMWALQQSSE